MKSSRTQPGKLDPKRSNAREAAVCELMSKQIQKVSYDFSQDGGAQGDFDLGARLPSGAMATNIWFRVDTPAAGAATPTIKLKCGGTDLTADFYTDVSGANEGEIALAGAAEAISCSGELAFELAAQDLTAGKFDCWVEFVS